MSPQWKGEVSSGRRFEFGANWTAFLRLLDDERIELAQTSLSAMLSTNSLQGKHFLDAGSGSGLFSLAARRLGAEVTSFDYDPQSVACTAELRRRYFPDDPHWRVMEGSVLDKDLLARLGSFDVVYSWGVLHHTGAMWQALENVVSLVATGGRLLISIYNDQGRASRRWARVKRAYVRAPRPLKWVLLGGVFIRAAGPSLIVDTVRGEPLRMIRNYKRESVRGMAFWRDLVDWAGGYPFEVAKPEQIFDFYRDHGFQLERLKTCAGGLGCNEYVFVSTRSIGGAAHPDLVDPRRAAEDFAELLTCGERQCRAEEQAARIE